MFFSSSASPAIPYSWRKSRSRESTTAFLEKTLLSSWDHYWNLRALPSTAATIRLRRLLEFISFRYSLPSRPTKMPSITSLVSAQCSSRKSPSSRHSSGCESSQSSSSWSSTQSLTRARKMTCSLGLKALVPSNDRWRYYIK